MRKNILKLLLIMLGLIISLVACGPRDTTTPRVEESQELRYLDKDSYIEEVVIILKLVRETLKIAKKASEDHAYGRITKQEFMEMAVSGRDNLERARVDISGVVPPSDVIIGKTTFEDMHNELISGIEWYIKAFDEMIKYGDDGRISHIDKATDYIENYGNPYINSVTIQLGIAQKNQ